MNKLLMFSAIAVLTLAAPGMELSAKCFSFQKARKIKVCVPGTGASARRQAKKVCRRIKGSSCGSISGYSGSCRRGRYTCYNKNGKNRRFIKSR